MLSKCENDRSKTSYRDTLTSFQCFQNTHIYMETSAHLYNWTSFIQIYTTKYMFTEVERFN